jgi:hypothetical protein
MDNRAERADASDEATTIYCSQALRNLWPSPLAQQWHDQYLGLFDSDDIRLSGTQPVNHFSEWFPLDRGRYRARKEKRSSVSIECPDTLCGGTR